jgi:hypothetical protein
MNKLVANNLAGTESALTLLNLLCVAALGWLVWQLSPSDMTDGELARRQLEPCVMDQDGYLEGQIYGAVQRQIAWAGDTMLCDGMQRPEGRGIRMIFSEHPDPDEPGLRFVFGLADAQLGMPAKDLEANVTIIDQLGGRFYSTQEQPRCWVTLDNQLQLSGTIEETWRVGGTLYCASALASLNDSSSVTLGDLRFSGVIKLSTD